MQQNHPTPLLAARGLQRWFTSGHARIDVLRGIDLDIHRGEFCVIVGSSGSGKSTLLALLGLLDQPSGGTMLFDGQPIPSRHGPLAEGIRSRRIGFVFQFYHLLPELDVLENVLLPVLVDSSATAAPVRIGERRDHAASLLEKLGLAHRLRHRPATLSGGERQRAAIARALVHQPDVLLADEPTGNLDRETGETILRVLLDLHTAGQTLVMVTHDPAIAARGARVLQLVDGRIR